MAREQFMISVAFVVDDAVQAELAALGAWVRLCAYCAPRLLGGRIKGAKEWADGLCMRALGMPRFTLDEVVASGLAEWGGSDLALLGYDLAGERIWKKKSVGGKVGGKASAAAYSSRDSSRTSSQDSSNESSPPLLQRDSDSDSVESPPGLSSDSESAREDDGDAPSGPGQGGESPPGGPGGGGGETDVEIDPRLAVVERFKANLVDKKTGEVLSTKWDTAFGQLSPEQVAEVFTHAKRLTDHEIRWPSGFAKALEALRVERRAAKRHDDQVEAQRVLDEQRAAATAKAEIDRQRSALQVAELDAYLGSEAGSLIARAIADYPTAARWLDGAHKHAKAGAGANLALIQLAKLYPELAPFQQIELPTAEVPRP